MQSVLAFHLKAFPFCILSCIALFWLWVCLRAWHGIRESINKYRHTFTYGEFQLLPKGNSAGPWAGASVRGVPRVGGGAFRSVLLRLAAGVTCCTLGFEHLAPEILPAQVAPLHLFIAESKQRRELNMWYTVKFSYISFNPLPMAHRQLMQDLSLKGWDVERVGVEGGRPRLTLWILPENSHVSDVKLKWLIIQP